MTVLIDVKVLRVSQATKQFFIKKILSVMNFFSIKAFIKVELFIQKKRAINKVFSGLQIAFLCNPFA